MPTSPQPLVLLAREPFRPPFPQGGYPELKRRVRLAGLLQPQPRYYALKIAATTIIAAVSLPLLLSSSNPWVRLCTAVYLAFVFAQFSFFGHDIGHHQVLHAGRACTILQLLFGNVLVGVSASWWMAKHNRHHSHPNRSGYDPDVTLPILAFSTRRARAMNPLQRLVVRYQHVLFVPLLLFESVVLRLSSIGFLVSRRGRHWIIELLLIGLHLAVYGYLVFHHLGLYPGLAFAAVHQMAFGLYMGSVFAPNHKGMPAFDDGETVEFLLEQVLTSRNVKPSPIVDFLYGGLNYQIEHHLFPSMPRNRLPDARLLVQSYCRENSIPYCETSTLGAYRDILRHLHTVGASA